jgi:hypothetical protein
MTERTTRDNAMMDNLLTEAVGPGWSKLNCDNGQSSDLDDADWDEGLDHRPGQGYHGRRWDAPMTDGMPAIDMTGEECSLCQEEIASDDDAIRLMSDFHVECLLRSTLGDRRHLQQRCECFGWSPRREDGGTYREQSQRALDYLVKNGQGRWADD